MKILEAIDLPDPACEICGAQFNQSTEAYSPSRRTPVNAHTVRLKDGKIAWACYCDAHGGQDRALEKLDHAAGRCRTTR